MSSTGERRESLSIVRVMAYVLLAIVLVLFALWNVFSWLAPFILLAQGTN